jgi:hypothetical protein
MDKFDIGLLQAKHLTNYDQWKGQRVIESLYILPDKSSRVLRNCTHAVAVNRILFGRGQQCGKNVLPSCGKYSEF